MRLLMAVALATAVAACNEAPTGSGPSGPVGSGGPIGENAANRTGEVTPIEAGDLPGQSAGLRFIGRWAADQRSCEAAAWRFTDTTLSTPAGPDCSFNRVTEVPGGYDIQATCTAEGPPTSDRLKIRFDEAADAMIFESETIADTRLLFCGREV